MSLHLARNLFSTDNQELFVRRAGERGASKQPWLESYRTFSFADYYDLRFNGFRKLKVLNEDRIAAGEGFPPHPHKNMEILSYVIEGGLAHKDNMEGDGIVNLIRPGELQRITTGSGLRHSEFNASEHGEVHFLQIWIEPSEEDLPPSYEQKQFSRGDRLGRLKLIASSDGREDSVLVHQDVSIFASVLDPDRPIHFSIHADRYGWLQIIKGNVRLNGIDLVAGDGVAIFGGGPLELKSLTEIDSGAPEELFETLPEVLLFDLA